MKKYLQMGAMKTITEVGDRTWYKGWNPKAYLKMLPVQSSLALTKMAGLGQAQG